MKKAIIAVHGVCPHPRYEIQDDFASGLKAALNRTNYKGGGWKTSILWPTVLKDDCTASDLHASALRVSASDDDDAESFDVYEAYWSPIDKNQTTVAKVLAWLLSSIFNPLNGYAKLWASRGKIAFDLFYLVVAAVFAIGTLAATSYFAYAAWNAYLHVGCADTKLCHPSSNVIEILTNPGVIAGLLNFSAFEALILTLVGAVCGWNGLFSLFMDLQRWIRNRSVERVTPSKAVDETVPKRSRATWRHYAQALLLFLAAACFFAIFKVPDLVQFQRPALWLVLAVGTLKGLTSFLSNFLVNFLGDVQIYCTHDENAAFYGMREKIVQTVENVVLGVLRSPADRPPNTTGIKEMLAEVPTEPPLLYEQVFVAAHSLGSSIAMDAILNVHELKEEQGITDRVWNRLAGFITFGTALEKTRFFFDVKNPSLSASVNQWRDDVNGQMFSKDQNVLKNEAAGPHRIFWANYWYAYDLVANEIRSYRAAPDKGVCSNVLLQSRFLKPLYHIWVHGDYLSDQKFWGEKPDSGVIGILTGQLRPPADAPKPVTDGP